MLANFFDSGLFIIWHVQLLQTFLTQYSTSTLKPMLGAISFSQVPWLALR